MRYSILMPVIAIALASCFPSGRIVEIDNSDKKIECLKLVQNVTVNSVNKESRPTSRLNNSISTTYLLQISKGERASLILEIQMQTSNPTDELDSLIFLYLDGEKIEIVADKVGSDQINSHQFIVPENLWISIANSEKIQYWLYIGKEGIDVKLNLKETNKLKEFFTRAMLLRDANLPPIPEGLKKL